MNKAVFDWIDAHQNELVQDLCDFIKIDSVKGAYEQGKPFGEGPFNALHFGMDLAEKYGFEIKNYDNYVATADYDNALPHTLDILAHTDVVPAGEGWTVTEPFKPVVKDGKIYGRGSSDDKGPLMAAMYAMRALKESGVELKKGIRLIMGADEESGSADIEQYYQEEQEAEMTFSPDAEFPIINIEKGMFRGAITKTVAESTALPRLVSLEAGVALNAVPQKAVIRLEGFDMNLAEAPMDEIAKELGVKCIQTGVDEITIEGVSAHASTPESGKNAGLAALYLINKLPLAACEQLTYIKKATEIFPWGETDGEHFGIKMCDEESHDLTCTLDLYHVTPTEMSFQFDSRVPVMGTKENCEDQARAVAEKAGFTLETAGMIPPHVVSGDSTLVKTLLGAYEDVTGLKGECLAIGGGTYVHELKNGVAFGAILPGIDTHMHGADEFMGVDNLVTAAKVYAKAIYELCK